MSLGGTGLAETTVTDPKEVPPLPPRGVKSPKRKRQYEHIKRSEVARGRSTKVAKRIAAATTNKTRRAAGETKKKRTRTSGAKKS